MKKKQLISLAVALLVVAVVLFAVGQYQVSQMTTYTYSHKKEASARLVQNVGYGVGAVGLVFLLAGLMKSEDSKQKPGSGV